MIAKKNHITTYNDVITFHTYGLAGRLHSNHAVKVIVAEQPVSVAYNKKLFTAHGLIIKSDTIHKIKPHEGLVISIYIDPESILGGYFHNLFKNVSVLKFESSVALNLFKFLSASSNHITEEQIKTRIQKHLLPSPGMPTIDERIDQITRVIKGSKDCSIKFSDLLDLCSLSESRLIHLFKKEVGITIRKYTLWCRTLRAITAMSSGMTIKQSAKTAGFTDAAHFNRTFVAMYGITPSLMIK